MRFLREIKQIIGYFAETGQIAPIFAWSERAQVWIQVTWVWI